MDDEIFEYSFENMNTRLLRYEDALCICFLQLLKKGASDDCKMIRQVIIDEVQDYTPLHYEILKVMYPFANYTILGDVNQSIGRKVTMDYYDQISQILNRPKSLLVSMNKSFRCSRQILEFSAKFLDDTIKLESFCRDGDEPQIYKVQTEDELHSLLLKEIKTCLDLELESIAIVCENQKAANLLQQKLAKHIDITVICDSTESSLTKSKIFTIPLYMAKGLEFDGVLVVNITNKQHLYIAATRALHRLNVYELDS